MSDGTASSPPGSGAVGEVMPSPAAANPPPAPNPDLGGLLSPATPNDGLIPAPDYFGPEVRIHPDYARHYDYLQTVFSGSGVRAEIANHGMAILEEAEYLELPEQQQAAHRYDTSRFIFRAEDQPGLTYFLNRMHEKGAKQHEVSAFLTLYRDAEIAREKRARMNEANKELDMAYSSTNPARKILDFGLTNGLSLWAYESTHPHATVEGTDFFAGCGKGSPGDAAIGMQIGDVVLAINQSTAGTSAITWHRVTSLTTSTGWGSLIDATVSAGSS